MAELSTMVRSYDPSVRDAEAGLRLRPACHTYAKPKTIPPPLPPHIPPNSNGKRAVPIMEKQPPKKKPKQNTNLKILQDLRKPKPLNHKPISFLKKRS